MKVILYGVGSTATRAVSRLKTLIQEQDGVETICRGFDMDNKSQAAGLGETELYLATEDNFRGTLEQIVANQHINRDTESIYHELNTLIPLNDPGYIRLRPETRGLGASKDPSVSAAVGFLHQDDIHRLVDHDTTAAVYGNPRNEKLAYVILSPCGGTSTGLHLPVVGRLLEKGFTVNLFMLTPRYFMRVGKDYGGQWQANTVATLLRIAFEKDFGKMRSLKNTPSTSRLYPFLIESDWDTNTFAEYVPKERIVSEEAFLTYVSRVLMAFILNDHPLVGNGMADVQSWRSTYANNENDIRQNQTYFNLILLYPRHQALRKFLDRLLEDIKSENGQDPAENMRSLLSKLPGPKMEVRYAIQRAAGTVKELLTQAIDNSSMPVGSLHKLFEYIRAELSRKTENETTNAQQDLITKPERSKASTAAGTSFRPGTTDDKKHIDDDVDPSRKAKKTIWSQFVGLFNKSPEINDDDDEPVVDRSNSNFPAQSQVVSANELEKWVDTRLKQFILNKTYLMQLKESVDEEVDYPVDEMPEVGTEIQGSYAFTQDLQPTVKALKAGQANFPTPPTLNEWYRTDETLDYNQVSTLQNKPYQLRIFSLLRVESLTYMRGDFIESYNYAKQAGRWCYPDRRYQGIPLIGHDSLTSDFVAFESAIVKKLTQRSDSTHPVSINEGAASLFALAYIFNQLDVTSGKAPKSYGVNGAAKKPKSQLGKAINKPVDLRIDPAQSDYWFIQISANGHTIKGTSADAYHSVAVNGWNALRIQEPADAFFPAEATSTSTTLGSEVLKQAKQTLFNLDKDLVKNTLTKAFNEVQTSLAIPEGKLPDEQAYIEVEFRKRVYADICVLMNEYNTVLEKHKKLLYTLPFDQLNKLSINQSNEL